MIEATLSGSKLSDKAIYLKNKPQTYLKHKFKGQVGVQSLEVRGGNAIGGL